MPSEMKMPFFERVKVSFSRIKQPLTQIGSCLLFEIGLLFSRTAPGYQLSRIPHIVRSPVMMKSLYFVLMSNSSISISGMPALIPCK